MVQRQPRVAILLATYNGENHLAAQLDSIALQTGCEWVIYVSDDGSSDCTGAILRDYQHRLGKDRLILLDGPRGGYAANFMALLRHREIEADYFAFSDQDDWWHPHKLARALAWIVKQPQSQPSLYCGRTRLINEDGQPIGYSPLFSHKPSFRNALVQSLAGANTMLLNRTTRELMIDVALESPIISHDWWAYLVTTGCGGVVFYDAIPTIDYRQHDGNLIGSNNNFLARLGRLRMMLGGAFRAWSDANLVALASLRGRLSADSLRTLQCFESARQVRLVRRLWLLMRAGVYRQTLAGNLGLLLAAILRRF